MGKCKECEFLFPVARDAGDYPEGKLPACRRDGIERWPAPRVRHQGESSS